MRRVLTILPLCCAWGVLGTTAPLRGEEPADAKLKKLSDDSRARAAGIEVKVTVGDRATKATIHPDPLMKYTDVPRQIEMATLWVWHDDGRPVAFGKVEAYGRKDGTKWLYCFASASPELVEGKWPDGRRFQARKAGIEWATLKGPAPQETAAGRVRQMKELFQRFTATTRDDALKTSDDLRPLARPLHEYSAPKQGVVQGVVCGFAANGTNPDVIVALEAADGLTTRAFRTTWRYGVIGMTASGISVKLDKNEVFTRPYVNTLEDRRQLDALLGRCAQEVSSLLLRATSDTRRTRRRTVITHRVGRSRSLFCSSSRCSCRRRSRCRPRTTRRRRSGWRSCRLRWVRWRRSLRN